jgi:hypothetical protein
MMRAQEKKDQFRENVARRNNQVVRDILSNLYLRIRWLVGLVQGKDRQISAISTHKHAPALCSGI